MKSTLFTLIAGLLLSLSPVFGASAQRKTSTPGAAPKTAAPSPDTPAKTDTPKTETIDLQSKGRVVLTLPARWTIDHEDPGSPLDLTLKGPAGVNAVARITFGFPDDGAYESISDLRERMTELGQTYEDESVEHRTVLQPFTLRSGYGFYSNFTDPKLVGKKPVPEDYKVCTVGIIRPVPGLVAVIMIYTDDVAGPEFQKLRQVVETLEVLGPGGARRRTEL